MRCIPPPFVRRLLGAACAVLLSACAHAFDSGSVEILNDDSPLRVHIGFNRVDAAGKGEGSAPERMTDPPPAGWTALDFDDRAWARAHAPLRIEAWPGGGLAAAENHLVCARAKFRVDDPGAAAGLQLTLAFTGGAVVYLNGKELARAGLPAGALAQDTPAEAYPDEAYITADGFLLDDPKADGNRISKRTRRLEAHVPPGALVKGVNVLAVEVHRAPVAEVFVKSKYKKANWRGPVGVWSHATLDGLALAAGAGAAVQPNVARPAGVQVWTAAASETLLHWSYGDPCESPALDLLAMRGGRVGGWIVVGSREALRGVRAEASELAGAEGRKLPAGALRVRYALPCEEARTFNETPGYDGLLDEPPAELPVSTAAPKPYWEVPYAMLRKPPVPGANVPVWVSVAVPAGAAPGAYRGTVTVHAEGLPPVAVPVSVEVAAWRMPADDALVSKNNLYQSHETAALYYKLPLWSDEHFAHLGKLLAMSKELGNRLCMIHLIEGAYHLNNQQSMVRWIRKGEGDYALDFAIVDRYLELFAQQVGAPKVVLLTLFHPYVDAKNKEGQINSATVTVLDPATGKTSQLRAPDYGTPESVAFWKPVLEGIFERLEKRGWKDAAVIGTPSDNGPKTPEPVSMVKELWPEARLMFSGHPNPTQLPARDKSMVPVACREHVWAAGVLYKPDGAKAGGGGKYPTPWKRGPTQLEWGFMRYGVACIHHLYESSPAAAWRAVEEATLQGNLNGVGRVGLDFWPLPVGNKPGNYRALSGDKGMHLGPSASTRMFFFPGPNGPVATWRSEVFREGLQIREAMIFLQQALERPGLEAELAERIREALDERARHYLRTHQGQPMLWTAFEGSGWQQRDGLLLRLCAEAEAKQAPAP
ncbi:MAG: hypothetical protein L6R28_10685 [Planctomycetes bacterium]|nr:hypothetical protein [Planctomycetota bacterium]